jgi:hypothetical protein
MNGGHLSITNTEFDNNYNSITLENYFTNHPDYYGSLDVSIAGCHFDNLGDQTYPNRITFPPYQNILPNAGILLQSIDAVIGDNQRATNTFENLQRGIYAITSHAQVLNADFTDIPPANGYQYSWPYRQAGILATGNDNDSPVDPILIAGNFEKALNFTNCKVGIATQKL